MRWHRHRWEPRVTKNNGETVIRPFCNVCDVRRKHPTWKYRIFRLRYVDFYGDDVHQWGVGYYPAPGARSDMGGGRQLGFMFGGKEAIFDLRWWWK